MEKTKKTKKKLSSSKKILIASLLVGTIVIGAVISLVIVLAAQTQGVSSTINVTYVVEDVGAKVSAKYYVVNPSTGEVINEKAMTTENGETEIEFLVTSTNDVPQTLTPPEEDIKLSSSSSRIVFEYKFTNTTDSAFTIDLTGRPDNVNMDVRYESSAVAKTDLQPELSGETLKGQVLTEPEAVTYVYVSADIANLSKTADYDGGFVWTLANISSTDEKLKEVTLTTADAQALAYADGDITYKYYDDENYQLPHLTSIPESVGDNVFAGYKIKDTDIFVFDANGTSSSNVTTTIFTQAKEAGNIVTVWNEESNETPDTPSEVSVEIKTETWNNKTYYYVEMGEYPQTLYKYSDTVPRKLTATSDTINIDLSGTYGYTRSGEGSYTTTIGYGSATNAFTIYTDANGNRYIWHKVCANSTSTSSTGNLYMDGTTHTTDGLAFFKLEPMKWDIVGYYTDDTKTTFVKVTDSSFDATHTENIVVKSRDALQGMSWNTEWELFDYPESTIYDYLQSFYTNYLEADYSDYINSVDNTYYDADQSGYLEEYDYKWHVELSDTTVSEKVWLIEREQVEEFFADDKERLTSPSDFALATCASQYKSTNYTTITKPNGGTCYWWLRSSYDHYGDCFADLVSADGDFYYEFVDYYGSSAVVPALLINL